MSIDNHRGLFVYKGSIAEHYGKKFHARVDPDFEGRLLLDDRQGNVLRNVRPTSVERPKEVAVDASLRTSKLKDLVLYWKAVEKVFSSNQDQPGFDLFSAMAAVDSMLDDANDDINVVLVRI